MLVKLKSILRKGKGADQVLADFRQKLGIDFWITDESNRVVWGEAEGDPKTHPVFFQNEIVGQVHGEGASSAIAGLISHLLSKELEKKEIGKEVLELYREINAIYDFSEKLSEIISPKAIADLALTEASRLIPSTAGIVLLLDQDEDQLEAISVFGDLFSQNQDQLVQNPILKDLVLGGQAEITSGLLLNMGRVGGIRDISVMLHAPLKVEHRAMGTMILVNEEPVQYDAADLKLLTTLAAQSASSMESAFLYERQIRESREREEAMREVHEATTRFVPFEFIKSLGHTALTDIKLGDQVERRVTVLFLDIRDYTTLSEQMTPEENFGFVNAFNGRLGPVIRNHGGFVNQYLGDGMMAIFPGEPEQAVQAAVRMQMSVQVYNKYRKTKDRDSIRIGIGMHTGPLILGITGDQQRLDAATISDTVNTASRVESLTKYYGNSIILTGQTFEKVKDIESFNFRPLGRVQVKGKMKAVSIFECFDGDDMRSMEKKKQNQAEFEKALQLYHEKEFGEALQLFKRIIENDPGDQTASLFLNKSSELMNVSVPHDWSGVEEMSVK